MIVLLEYKSIQGQVCQSICNEHLAKILNSSSNLNGNKPFWHYFKFWKKDQNGISSLHADYTNGVATTPVEKVKF